MFSIFFIQHTKKQGVFWDQILATWQERKGRCEQPKKKCLKKKH
jgi:hypothetical protein